MQNCLFRGLVMYLVFCFIQNLNRSEEVRDLKQPFPFFDADIPFLDVYKRQI